MKLDLTVLAIPGFIGAMAAEAIRTSTPGA